jgi:hypothetical protein
MQRFARRRRGVLPKTWPISNHQSQPSLPIYRPILLILLAAAIAAGAWITYVSVIRTTSIGPTDDATVPASIVIDPAAPGGLIAARAVVDLGRVPFDRRADAVFELVNTGGTPVRLVKAPTVAMLEGC